jgi:gp16 family phage-associated protein
MEQKPIRTREQALESFSNKGISVRSWALANGLSPAVVRGVLSGRLCGRFGEAHKAAVKLGVKVGEIVEDICHA